MGCGSSTKTKDTSGREPTRDDDSSRRPTSRSDDRDTFIHDSLKAHNELRKKHSAAPLKHSPELTEYSQQWANKLVKMGTMKHSNCTLNNGDRVGENIYYSWGSHGTTANGRTATQSWYDEIKDHDFDNNNFQYESGHFSQVIWAGTKEMGCAYAYTPDGKTVYVVANYRPAGNVQGQFLQNVKRH